MELTIHSYGYLDALFYVLNGLAMFRNSGFYTTLINGVAILVACYFGVRMAYCNSYSQIRHYILKVLGMVIMINALLLPKTNMLLQDHVTKSIERVDNIPLAFALPVGVLEEFGQLLTIGFEQVFAPIEAAVDPTNARFSYYNYGMLFGARLKKEVSQARIKNPEFIGNMHNFIKQCVMLPAMIGYKFTKEQLMATDNMWDLVSKKAGTLTRVDVMIRGKNSNLSCKEAADYFTSLWQEENERIFLKYRDTDFGKARSKANYGVPTVALATVFEQNLKVLYGGSKPASEILRQQMMINSLSDYKSSNFGVARARMQQESSNLLSSDLASLYLPMMLAVFKCIVYAAFIFLVPLLVLSGGISKYTSYLTVAASLQLWPALNSIINMIMGTYSNLPSGSNMLMSFSTASTTNNNIDTIVTIAGGLQIIVPFLAVWMTQLGMGGLTHLAGNIIGGLQSAAGSIGSEVASGNRSMDNINYGNSQRNVHGANKLDYNTQYAEGASTYQQADGTVQKVLARGNTIFTGGAGTTVSSGSTKYNQEENRHAQVNTGVQMSEAMHNNDLRSFSAVKAKTFTKTADYVSHLAEREHSGKSVNYEKLGEEGKALQQAVNHTKQLYEKGSHSWSQAGQAALKASVSVRPPLGKLAAVATGVDASISAEASVTTTNSSEQSVGNDSIVNRDDNTNETYNNIVKAASSDVWTKDKSIDRSYSDAVRESYEDQQRLEKNVSISKQAVEDWHQVKSIMDSQGYSSSRDMYQEVLDRCVQEFGMSANSVEKMVEKGHPEVMKVWHKMQQEDSYIQDLQQKIKSDRAKVSGSQADEKLGKFSNQHQSKVNDDGNKKILEYAKTQGLNPDQTQQEISQQKANLQGKHAEITTKNAEQYNSVKQSNEVIEKDLIDKTNKYEQKRKEEAMKKQNTDNSEIFDYEEYDSKYKY